MPSASARLLIAISVLAASVTAGPALADPAAETTPSYQLEAGTNVKLIDLGANGMEELAKAVERLNAPPPAPATPPPTEAAPGDTATNAPAESATADSTPPAIEAGQASHPGWLLGKWGLTPQCATSGSQASGRMVEISAQKAIFNGQQCDIKAVATPKEDEAIAMYLCRYKTGVTQEAHVFRKVSDHQVLVDHVDTLSRCEG